MIRFETFCAFSSLSLFFCVFACFLLHFLKTSIVLDHTENVERSHDAHSLDNPFVCRASPALSQLASSHKLRTTSRASYVVNILLVNFSVFFLLRKEKLPDCEFL